MMRQSQFVEITAALRTLKDVRKYVKNHPEVSYDTVMAIYILKRQKQAREETHADDKTKTAHHYQAWKQGQSLESIALASGIPPFQIAKKILILYLQEYEASQPVEAGATEQRRPLSIKACQQNVGLIPDERLRKEVARCIAIDEFQSPIVDKIRQTIGIEYEFVLQEKLRSMNIVFASEGDQRSANVGGKTPDIKLIIPVGVDGENIAWVESKAMFGDEYTFHQHESQLKGYVTRFGPGMVIYWFGFVDIVQGRIDGVLVKDKFPDASALLTLHPQETHTDSKSSSSSTTNNT